MTLRERLARCAERAGAQLSPTGADQVTCYLEVLAYWNRRINLTSLPLEGYPDSTLDRLVGEPLTAAAVTPSEGVWFDLGSGGGSPAIPLRILRPGLRLTMVEVREKKAAFLRELVRQLELPAVRVLACRLETLSGAEGPQSADLVTVRAVKLDARLFDISSFLLKPGGRLVLFTGEASQVAVPDGFLSLPPRSLPTGSSLLAYERLDVS